MGLIGDLLSWLGALAVDVIDATGYLGVFFLMVLESMVFPVPSEAVLPFAGFLAARGDMGFLLALAAATVGSLVGSLLSYYMGVWGLAPLVRKYGKYFLLHEKHVDQAHAWAEKKGAGAIFLSRFVPGVRHVVSIPAGAVRMPMGPFLLATGLGAGLWNLVLLYAGFALGERWHDFEQYKSWIDVVVLSLLAVGLVAGALYWRSRRRLRAIARPTGAAREPEGSASEPRPR